MLTAKDDAGRPLLTFHGTVKIHQQRGTGGVTEYVVTPLDHAAALEALASVRVREAWYAGVNAALQEAETQSVEAHPLVLGRLRAGLLALRYPRDSRDE